KVPNFSHSGRTCTTISVPSATPGARPIAIGSRRARTAARPLRLTHSTYAFSTTSIGTSAGVSTRLVRKSSASGTVIDEKPYPNAPLTMAATVVMRTSSVEYANGTWFSSADRGDAARDGGDPG